MRPLLQSRHTGLWHWASIKFKYSSKVWRHRAQLNLLAGFIWTKDGGTQKAKHLNRRGRIVFTATLVAFIIYVTWKCGVLLDVFISLVYWAYPQRNSLPNWAYISILFQLWLPEPYGEPAGLARLQRRIITERQRITTQRRCHCRETTTQAEGASLNQSSSLKSSLSHLCQLYG